MARTVVAVFDSVFTAGEAVEDLRKNGLSKDLIDVAAQSKNGKTEDTPVSTDKQILKPEVIGGGMAVGARVGLGIGSGAGITGALLVAIGSAHISGLAVDPGAAITALTVTGVCIVLGGLLGQAIGLGIPEHEERQYAQYVHESNVVVSVRADWDAVDPVKEILNRYSPLEVKERTPGDRR